MPYYLQILQLYQQLRPLYLHINFNAIITLNQINNHLLSNIQCLSNSSQLSLPFQSQQIFLGTSYVQGSLAGTEIAANKG